MGQGPLSETNTYRQTDRQGHIYRQPVGGHGLRLIQQADKKTEDAERGAENSTLGSLLLTDTKDILSYCDTDVLLVARS